MGVETTARPRAGFLHRLQCARDGHYWERQLSDDGGQARWVCIRCGKQGDVVPLVSSMGGADPDAVEHDAVAAGVPEFHEPDVPEDTGVIELEPERRAEAEPAPDDVRVQPEAPSEPRAAPEPEPEPQAEWTPPPEPSATSGAPSLVAVAVVSLIVVGGVYMAFRRRRRR
jgi:hypothetical protein